MIKKIIYSTVFISSINLALSEDLEDLVFTEVQPKSLSETEFLGFEAVTGYRHNYFNRGEKLTKHSIDFQFHGQYSSSNNNAFEYGLWYLSGVGSATFTEAGALLNYTEYYDSTSYSVGVSYRDFSNYTLDNELEINASFGYQINDYNEFKGSISYETQAEQWYTNIRYTAYYDVSKNSFFQFSLNAGFSDNYFGKKGLIDISTRLNYTYNLTKQISVTPYIGGVHSNSEISLDGGLWFETSF